MALYTVYAPPPEAGATAPDPLRFVFVKDGFCWPALFVPELWLLFRRMWLVFLVYLAASAAVSIVGAQAGGPLPWAVLILMHLLFALEANALRRWKLSSAGYTFVGVANGRRSEAEIRFFSQWEPPAIVTSAPTGSEPAEASPTPSPDKPEVPAPAPAPVSAESGGVVGLFPAPGGAT
jgi:hypothetical protein